MCTELSELYEAIKGLGYANVLLSSKDGVPVRSMYRQEQPEPVKKKNDINLCAMAAVVYGMANIIPPTWNEQYSKICKLREVSPKSIYIAGDKNTFQIHDAGECLIFVQESAVPKQKKYFYATPFVEGTARTIAELLGQISSNFPLGETNIPESITLIQKKEEEIEISYPSAAEINQNINTTLEKKITTYRGANIVEMINPLKFGRICLKIPELPSIEDMQIRKIIEEILVD